MSCNGGGVCGWMEECVWVVACAEEEVVCASVAEVVRGESVGVEVGRGF